MIKSIVNFGKYTAGLDKLSSFFDRSILHYMVDKGDLKAFRRSTQKKQLQNHLSNLHTRYFCKNSVILFQDENS